MQYAKVVVGLPVEGPFDYSVPQESAGKIAPGCRVWVPWRTQKKVGVVVALAKKTSIPRVRPILSLIDCEPLLTEKLLALAKQMSEYYCCSWGEAIEAVLPAGARQGKPVPPPDEDGLPVSGEAPGETPVKNILIHDASGTKRWEFYYKEIERCLSAKKQVILLLPEKESCIQARDQVTRQFPAASVVLYEKSTREYRLWSRIKAAACDIVIGTRSAVFVPLARPGLIIVDQEHDESYKQDQSPHYHGRQVAIMRAQLEGASLVMGSTTPSVESFYRATKGEFEYVRMDADQKASAQVMVIDSWRLPAFAKAKTAILTRYLQDAIAASLAARERILLFLNRHGFATLASCISCGSPLDCPRCSIHLVYHYAENEMRCHYCNFSMPLPKLCPKCNAGYIKFSGMGTQKLESELALLFPQARIRRLDGSGVAAGGAAHDEADIYIATEALIHKGESHFDTVGVLSIDTALNRPELRASEKAFSVLSGLARFAGKRFIIQTHLVNHHAFAALEKDDARVFYEQELAFRKQLRFPPYAHLAYIKFRGTNRERVESACRAAFESFQAHPAKGITFMSCASGSPVKLRGNYYWQILAKAGRAQALSKFLKSRLKKISSSGIIVTVDIDPL